MPFTNVALDTFFAQEISSLTSCDAPDLSDEFEQSEYWVNNFILNSIFRVNIKVELKPLIFGVLRRAQMALVEYENGRVALLDFLGGPKERISVYFRALYHVEIAATLLYQGYELISKLVDKPLYEPGDDSPIQRLNAVYNISKHLESSTIEEGHLHAVWLTNAGIAASRARLSWNEFGKLITDLGRLADGVSDPSSLKKDGA